MNFQFSGDDLLISSSFQHFFEVHLQHLCSIGIFFCFGTTVMLLNSLCFVFWCLVQPVDSLSLEDPGQYNYVYSVFIFFFVASLSLQTAHCFQLILNSNLSIDKYQVNFYLDNYNYCFVWPYDFYIIFFSSYVFQVSYHSYPLWLWWHFFCIIHFILLL